MARSRRTTTISADIPFFGGPVTSVDASRIPDHNCTYTLNARYEDGVLKPRKGSLLKSQAQLSNPNTACLTYLSGYDNSYAHKEDLLFSNYDISQTQGTLWRTDSSLSGSFSQLKSGTNGAIFYPFSSYVAAAFDGRGYIVPTAGGTTGSDGKLLVYDIGDSSSAIAYGEKAQPPDVPAQVYVGDNGDSLNLSGLVPSDSTHMLCTGAALNDGAYLIGSGGGHDIVFKHSYIKGASSITIDLSKTTIGKRDWYWRDSLFFIIEPNYPDRFKIDGITVSIENDSSVVAEGQVFVRYQKNPNTGNDAHFVYVWFDAGKTRSDWGDGAGSPGLQYIKISYNVTKTSSGNEDRWMTVGWFKIGWPQIIPIGETKKEVETAYSYYSTVQDAESPLSLVADGSKFGWGTVYYGEMNYNGKPYGYAVRPYIRLKPTTAYDTIRIYVKDDYGTWRRIASVAGTTSLYIHNTPWADIYGLPEYRPRQMEGFKRVTNLCPYRGWMVWLGTGGKENVMHSRVGQPLYMASNNDDPTDPKYETFGANYTLSDDFADEPVSAHQVDDALVILGNEGAYVQFGDRPTRMSPCQKLPGSVGVAGKYASCRWVDDEGRSVVAYVDKHMNGLYLAYPSLQGISVVEYTLSQKGMFRDFLKSDGTGYLDPSSTIVVQDGRDTSLWVIHFDKALVLRRKSIASGSREWEHYKFGFNINSAVYVPGRGMYALDDGGRVYELDTDGTATELPTQVKWVSKRYDHGWTLPVKILVNRVDDEEEVQVKVTSWSDSGIVSSSVIPKKYNDWSSIPASHAGRSHQIEVDISPDSKGVRNLSMALAPAGRKW